MFFLFDKTIVVYLLRIDTNIKEDIRDNIQELLNPIFFLQTTKGQLGQTNCHLTGGFEGETCPRLRKGTHQSLKIINMEAQRTEMTLQNQRKFIHDEKVKHFAN